MQPYGGQMRNRVACKGRQSTVWAKQKNLLGQIASSWKTLTLVKQATWQAQVSNYPYVNKFGDSVQPSAYQLYCTLNLNLRLAGAPLRTTAIAPLPEINLAPVVLQINGSGLLEITYTAPGSVFYQIMVYCSPPQGRGITAIPNQMAFIQQISGGLLSPQEVDEEIAVKYGPVTDGQKYFMRLEIINIGTGSRYGNYPLEIIVSGHA